MVGEAGTALAPAGTAAFQSRCRDWVVGELGESCPRATYPRCFSLVAEIGWLARIKIGWEKDRETKFQSRCRDWVVGEMIMESPTKLKLPVSVSLPRLGGWRGFS